MRNKNDDLRCVRFLVNHLNEASHRYYNGLRQIMNDDEWNLLFNGLKEVERLTGIVLPNSPTQYYSNGNNENSLCNCKCDSQHLIV